MSLSENMYSPSVVYIPLTDSKAKLASVKAEVGSNVKVGTLLAEKYFGKERTPVYSSVSGKVLGIENRVDIDGNEVRHIAIKNDSKYDIDENVTPLKEGETIKEKLINLGIKDLDNSGIYTGFHFEDVKAIYVDAIYPNEAFARTNYEVLKDRAEKVISALSKYASEVNVPAYFVICKRVPSEVCKVIETEVAKTNNVTIVRRKQVPGWQYKLVRKQSNIELEVGKFKGVVVVSVSAMANVADAITYGLPAIKKGVTVYSNVVPSKFVEVPVGTPISQLFETEERVVVSVGGLLTGKTVVSSNTVVSSSTYSINVVKPVCLDSDDCNRCGLCNDVCPVGILPSEIIFADNLKDEEKLNTLHVDRCIECGRCSYVCPTRVNVLERVRRAKRRLQ